MSLLAEVTGSLGSIGYGLAAIGPEGGAHLGDHPFAEQLGKLGDEQEARA